MNVRARLLGACCGLSVLTALVGGAGIWGFATTNAAFQKAADENLQAVSHLAQADRDMQRALVAQRTLMFMKSDTAAAHEQVKRYMSSIEQIAEHWKAYVVVPAHAAEGKLRAEFEVAQAEWETSAWKVLKLLGQDSTDARKGAIDVSLNEGTEKFETARNLLRSLSDMRLSATTINARAMEARAAAIRWWMFMGIGAALASAFTVSLVLARSISRPLAETVEMLTATHVTGASQQRSEVISQFASGTQEQAASLEETATSLKEASADESKYHVAGESTAGTGEKKRRMRAGDPGPAEFIETITVKGTNGHRHGNDHSDDGFEEL